MSSSKSMPPEAPQIILSRGRELELERLKNQKLARELTRTIFEKEVLTEQVAALKAKVGQTQVTIQHQPAQAAPAVQTTPSQPSQLDMTEFAQTILEDLRREIGDVEVRLRNQLGGQLESRIAIQNDQVEATEERITREIKTAITSLSAELRQQFSQIETEIAATQITPVVVAPAPVAVAAQPSRIEAVGSPASVQTLIIQNPAAQHIVSAPLPQPAAPKPEAKAPVQATQPPPPPAGFRERTAIPSTSRAPREIADQINNLAGARHSSKSEELKRQLAAERIQFRKLAANFLKEIEFMKRVHPLRGLLKSKETELRRVKQIIQNVPRNHPERPQMERLIQAHEAERREIMLNLRQMESTLSEQTKQIDDAIRSANPEDLIEI